MLKPSNHPPRVLQPWHVECKTKNMVTINVLDKGKNADTIFSDLSEAFDTLSHNLLLAKLNASSFFFNAIKFF